MRSVQRGSFGKRAGKYPQVLESGVAVEDAAAVRAYVDSSVESRVAGNLQDQSPLVLVVVDSDPRARFVDGPKDAGLPVNGSD